jgi:hypothetical protein
MPVDIDTVIVQLQRSLKAIQPDIDTRKGPMKRLFIDTHAQVVSNERNQIDRLVGLFTLQRLDSILTTEIDAQVSSFSGMGRFQGRKAHGFVTFYTRSRSAGDIVIDIGVQVADETASLVYRVTQQIVVSSSDLPKFFNPTNQRFEILAPVEAMSIGSDYEVSENRIKRILTPVNSIDGVINYSGITDGLAIEDNDSLDSRFRKRLEGQSLGTKGGLISEIVNIPGVLDVSIVTPADYDLFSRRTDRPALDIYVIGDIETTDSVAFSVTTGKRFQLPPHVVTSIISVTLDGEVVNDYAFIRDASVLAGSVQEVDTIELRAQPDVGSAVVVEFTFNSLLESVQARASQFGDFAYFGTDLLTYAAIPVPMSVGYTFSYLSSFDKASTMQALQNETMNYMNPNKYVGVMQPEAFIADLQRKIPSAISIGLSQFTSRDGSTSSIQIVQFPKNKYPILAQVDLQILLAS